MATLVFCTAYSESLRTWDYRWKRWITAVSRSGLHYDQILIVDDGSPILPEWHDTAIIQEGNEIPTNQPICLYHFATRKGQHIDGEPFPGWYRSFSFACLNAIERNFDKIVHIEADAFLISHRAVSYFNATQAGWTALWCPHHTLPESTLQIICQDQFPRAVAFLEQPYRSHLSQPIETLLPFTHVETNLAGDRFGEFSDHVPRDADYASQLLWDQDDSYFWWQSQQRARTPQVVSISMIKNEVDIIEPFIRHNKRFVNHMILLDNDSIDDTRNIIKKIAQEIEGISFTDIMGAKYTQSAWMTTFLLRVQTSFFADFVIFLDADEFIAATDRDAFLAALDAIPRKGCGLIRWRNHVLHPTDTNTGHGDPPRSLPWRRKKEHAPRAKVVLRLDRLVPDGLVVAQGNHSATTPGTGVLPEHELAGIYLKHFPVRGTDQVIAKAVVGWAAYMAKDPKAREKGDGYHWREMFDGISSHGSLTFEQVCNLSVWYDQAKSPIDWQSDIIQETGYFDYVRKYSNGKSLNALSAISRSWEASLRHPLPAEPRTSRKVATSAKFVDLPPFRFLIEKYQPKSVFDVGAEHEDYLELAKDLGVEAIAGMAFHRKSEPSGIVSEVVTLSPDLAAIDTVPGPRDMVICMETLHQFTLDRAYGIIEAIAGLSRSVIVFSAAGPGQPGLNQRSRLPIVDWLLIWERFGWSPELDDTFACRAMATLPWFQRNIVVLRPRRSVSYENSGIDELGMIEARKFHWRDTSPIVQQYITIEDVVGLGSKYSSDWN